MARPPKPPHRIKHGTPGGYMYHYRNKTPICEPCKRWKKRHNKEYQAKIKRDRKRLFRLLTNGHTADPGLTAAQGNALVLAVRKLASAEDLKEMGLD